MIASALQGSRTVMNYHNVTYSYCFRALEYGQIFGFSTITCIVSMAIIGAFSIVLLADKKWGAVALGGVMSVWTTIGTVTALMEDFVAQNYRVELESVLILLALFLFVSVPCFVGWILYMSAGILSIASDRKDQRYIFSLIFKILAMITKSVAAILVFSAGIGFLLFTLVFGLITGSGINFAALLGNFVFPYGGVMIALAFAFVVLAIGMILSVRCRHDDANDE